MTYRNLPIEIVSNYQNKPFPSCTAGNWDFTYTSQPTYAHGKFESSQTSSYSKAYIIMGVDKFWKVGGGGANVLCVMFFAKNNFYCPLFSCSPVI